MGLVKRKDGQYHILIYGYRGFHKNNVFGGNILLPLQIEVDKADDAPELN